MKTIRSILLIAAFAMSANADMFPKVPRAPKPITVPHPPVRRPNPPCRIICSGSVPVIGG